MIAAADVLLNWVQSHPSYTYTVDAAERGAGGAEVRVTMRVSYAEPSGIERVRVLAGNGAGTEVVYGGGERATVRPPGLLHALALRVGIRDPRLLSPRKNDLRTAIFGEVAACVARHGSAVVALPFGDGRTAIEIRDPAGFGCGPSDGDDRVTLDRIVVAGDGRPLVRERYVGDVRVVRWTIRDLQADGLARVRRERAQDGLVDERAFLRGRRMRDERLHRHVCDAAAPARAAPDVRSE